MIDQIQFEARTDQALTLRLKDPESLNLNLFERMANDDLCIPCLLKNEAKAQIIYSIKGLISLSDFLAQYSFKDEEGYCFLVHLFEQAIACNRNKPVLFVPEYVYVTPYGDNFGFIVVPIKIDEWMLQKDSCLNWVRYIAANLKTDAYEIIGYLIALSNSDEFSLSNMILGLENIRRFYYPKKLFSFKHRHLDHFCLKEPVMAYPSIVKDEPSELLNKTQLLIDEELEINAYLMIDDQCYDLENEISLIGRSSACDIRLSDNSVSLKHAKITCNDDRFYIQDLKSSNKTFIEDKEVKRKMRLKNGMNIYFGRVHCVFYQRSL